MLFVRDLELFVRLLVGTSAQCKKALDFDEPAVNNRYIARPSETKVLKVTI